MTLIQLTEVTNLGDGPRPLMVNPDHVATLRPRKTLKPIAATQDLLTELAYDGTILTLATGAQHFVTEDFDAVHAMLAPEQPDPVSAEITVDTPEDPPPADTPRPVKKSHHKQPAKPVPAKSVPSEPVADGAFDMSALIPE